jgi:hydrogenase assembly chaperone HypC/HupF
MCLSIPYQIKKIKGKKAIVDSCLKKKKMINLDILPKAKVGDWVLALNNFAVQKISDKQVKELLKLLKGNKKGKEV